MALGVLAIFNLLAIYLLFAILNEYKVSNQLRAKIFSEAKQFNSRHSKLTQTALYSQRKRNLKIATMILAQKEGNENGVHARRPSGKGGN